MDMIAVLWPEADTPIFLAPIKPREVSTPMTAPSGRGECR